MSYFIDICLVCLEHSVNLIQIRSRDKNGIIIADKLQFILPKHELNLGIPKYICVKCENNLRYDFEFKQKCLQNITTYEKYAQQISTIHGSYRYLSVIVRPDFVYEEARMTNKNNYDTNEVISEQDENIQSRSFRQSRNLKQHKLLHTGEKQFTCEVCKKSFRRLDILKQHEHLHSSEKKFDCNVCNKSFSQLQGLTRHQFLHTGEKSHTCEVCQKLFARLDHLKKHNLVHTGEKQFYCKICKKPFGRLDHLKKHNLVHTGEKAFYCEVCKKSFGRLAHLKQHNLVHEAFNCKVCKKSFERLGLLQYHNYLTH